jgi:phage gp46-like protein
MPDLRLYDIVTPFVVTFDLLQKPDNLIDESQAFATAVMVALGTDRRAYDDDILPNGEADTDRRGWWGDTNADVIWPGAWPIGSRLWLLERHKITDNTARQGSTLARVDAYIREALQPFISQQMCSRVDVTVTRAELQKIVAEIVIYRGPLPTIRLQYQSLWNEIGA